MTVSILQGDALTRLRELPDESVQCCVTSPPYFGLRDYNIDASVWGGDAAHAHEFAGGHVLSIDNTDKRRWNHTVNGRGEEQPEAKRIERKSGQVSLGAVCECGAWRGALGLEPTPDLFVAHVVDLFREVRRVLCNDGTLWLNMGDSYAGSWGAQSRGSFTEGALQGRSIISARQIVSHPHGKLTGSKTKTPGLKPKDLIGIPWMLAFALRADGWFLRQDIIWSKPNPILSKRERYYYDADAIAEPASSSYDPDNAKAPDGWDTEKRAHGRIHPEGRAKGKSGNKARKPGAARGCPENSTANVCGSVPWEGATRNKRSVWTVTTQPFKGAHFATFPPKLIEPMIKAGCPVGGTVLDPFGGAGTTGLVADRLGRNAILIELNPDYCAMARERIREDAPLLNAEAML